MSDENATARGTLPTTMVKDADAESFVDITGFLSLAHPPGAGEPVSADHRNGIITFEWGTAQSEKAAAKEPAPD